MFWNDRARRAVNTHGSVEQTKAPSEEALLPLLVILTFGLSRYTLRAY